MGYDGGHLGNSRMNKKILVFIGSIEWVYTVRFMSGVTVYTLAYNHAY